MQIRVSKRILSKYISLISSRCSFLYGMNSNYITRNMNNISNVFVSDEMKSYNPMYFNIPTRSIHMNLNYVRLDRSHRLVTFVNGCRDDQKHTLIHELLHAASTNEDKCGIPKCDSASTAGLNEGITQMLTDDICGYVENKFLESYNDLKIAAKIIRTTFGNKVICDSYFNNSEIIVNKLNRISRNRDYYDRLNAKLSELNTLFIRILDKNDNIQADHELYEKKLIHIYKDMVINIVIPHIKTLDSLQKEKYVTELMLDIGSDSKIKNEIKSLISKMINMNESELDFLKYSLQGEYDNLEKERQFISLVKDDYFRRDKIYVSNSGMITLLGSPSVVITSSLQSKIVYSRLFDLKYPSFNTEELLDYLSNMLSGKYFNINKKSVLDKRIIFCGIQKRLLKVGYNLLNDYRELDYTSSIKPLLIPVDRSKLKLSDLKKIYDKYGVYNKLDGEHDYNLNVVDKKMFFKIDNYVTKYLAFFAYNWANAFDNEKIAFSSEGEYTYSIIINAMNKAYSNTNNFDLDYIEKYCTTSLSKKVLRKLLSSPIKTEWVFDFIEKTYGNSKLVQEFKAESYNHRDYNNYDEYIAKRDASMILNK